MREEGYDLGRWYFNGFWGPAGMPRNIVDVLQGHLSKAIHRPEVREKLESVGNEASGLAPDDMAREMKRFQEYWGKHVGALGVSLN